MLNKTSINIQIKGRSWEFTLVPDKTFDKLHNVNDEGHTAMTMVNQYKTDFRKSDWCFVDIIHELGHVIYSLSPTRSVTLEGGDVEEVMCDIYSSDYFEIGLIAGRIAEKFFGRK
jgi:hypothetical protein